ncbi:MAG: SRPBCC domain-containing protein [Polyangiales bacterium]
MKPTDKTDRAQTETLSFEFDLRHPPQKVWRALTEPALLREWLLPVTGFALEPGAAFEFRTQPQPGWDGTVQCRLLEAEAQRKISYTWVVGEMDTVVTFTLAPTATGTLLSLVHTGFKPHQKQNFGGARYGWNLMGAKLFATLDAAETSTGGTP